MANPVTPRRGDVYWAALLQAQTVGHKQGGRRAVVIVSDDAINGEYGIVVVVPLTSKLQKENRKHRILIPLSEMVLDPNSGAHLTDSVALTEHIRSISITRLCSPRIARLKLSAMAAIEAGIAYVLRMP